MSERTFFVKTSAFLLLKIACHPVFLVCCAHIHFSYFSVMLILTVMSVYVWTTETSEYEHVYVCVYLYV
jgi:hypothetical protein